MKQRQDTTNEEPRPITYEKLENWVRMKIQGFVQDILDEEVTELLGRQRPERRDEVDAPKGYRNGYGKQRELDLSCGTIRLTKARLCPLHNPIFASWPREAL